MQMTAYTFTVGNTGGGWTYWVSGPANYCHQPSKLWRTKAMAIAAAKRAVKRKQEQEAV